MEAINKWIIPQKTISTNNYKSAEMPIVSQILPIQAPSTQGKGTTFSLAF